MKRRFVPVFVGCAVSLLAGPVFADRVIHLWECELEDDASVEELVELSKAWTAAVKKIEGAEDMEAFIEFPIAADAGFGEFTFVMVARTATAWGMFEDGYDGSEAQAIDEDWGEIASCDESGLWRSIPLQ